MEVNLINKEVTHKLYGQGIVVDLSDDFVEIKFPVGNKKFVFPDAFGTHLILKDKRTARSIEKIREERERQLRLEEERKAEERIAQLKEQQIRMEAENLIRNLKIHPSSQAVFWCEEDEQGKVFTEWCVFTGRVKSGAKKGRVNRPVRLHQNSACLLTKRDSDEPEKNRCILGAFMVGTTFVGKECNDGIIHAHDEYKIQLTEKESEKMLFWNYYVKEKNPQSITWNTGRYRYFHNIMMAQILRDMVSIKKKAEEKELAQRFFEHFCNMNRIDKNKIPKPDGALMRL
jgi:hypothetical protein